MEPSFLKEMPKFKSPTEELDYLRAHVAQKEKELIDQGKFEHVDNVASNVIKEYKEIPAQNVTHQDNLLTKKETEGIVLKLKPKLAPYKVAVFPLLKNKPELVEKAKEVYQDLKKHFTVAFDERGNIGKRYYSQDEIGTPFCITIDFDTLENDEVTVRDRDTMKQERIKIKDLKPYLNEKLI